MAREVEEAYIDTGTVRLIYVDFPVHGEPAILAAEAAHCAGKQDAFWTYHDVLFEKQFKEDFTIENLKKFATELELASEDFDACLDNNEFREEVVAQLQQAQQIGLRGTPSFIVRPSLGDDRGQFIPGLADFEQMSAVIETELAKTSGEEAGSTDDNTP